MWSHHFIFKKTKMLFYVLLFLLNHLKYFVTGWVPQDAKIRMQGVYWVLLPPTVVGVKSWALYAQPTLQGFWSWDDPLELSREEQTFISYLKSVKTGNWGNGTILSEVAVFTRVLIWEDTCCLLASLPATKGVSPLVLKSLFQNL